MLLTVAVTEMLPKGWQAIEVRVGELRQLFNAIDPSPFRTRDLDPRAEEFIVDWSRDLPRDAPLALVVHIEHPGAGADEVAALRDAVREYFGQRAAATRRKLRELLRRGRASLLIGLAFLATAIGISDALMDSLRAGAWAGILRESLVIGGWVAMWRPLEVFLYDWWPVRAEARLFDRLSLMPVKVVCRAGGTSDAWRSDWPVGRSGRPRSFTTRETLGLRSVGPRRIERE